MTLSKIVVGTDFSDQAKTAVGHAMSLSRHTGAKMTLMHALSMPEPDYTMPYPVTTPAVYVEQVEEIISTARTNLEDLRERLMGQGVDISHVFVNEMPDRGVVQVANEAEADLIVVGSHGRTGLSRFLIGSVAEQVARKASCDVLVARDEVPAGGYQRLLVPVDFSEVSGRAVARAAELLQPGGTIDLLHCWQLPGGSVTYWGSVGPGLRESIERGARDFGQKIVDKYSSDTVNINFQVEEGDARHIIEKKIQAGEYDLLVMGSHGRKGVNRLLLGSVTASIIKHVKGSVYVVRSKEPEPS